VVVHRSKYASMASLRKMGEETLADVRVRENKVDSIGNKSLGSRVSDRISEAGVV
jgi:hypothetical protein